MLFVYLFITIFQFLNEKNHFFLLSLFYFGCSSEPEADYFSEELLPGSRASNSTNDIRFSCSDLDNDDYCDDDDYWPLDPDMNENLWGVINDSE